MDVPLIVQCKMLNLPEPEEEYTFHPERGWRFDLAWPALRVAVVLDTSGSMGCPGQDGRALQEEALSEVLALTLAAGGECRGYACDAGVHAESPLAGRRDLGRLNAGGGGTDMVPGFLAALKRRPDLIVIVTDGLVGGGWPDGAQCRGRRVLAVLVGEEPPHPPSHIPFVEAHP